MLSKEQKRLAARRAADNRSSYGMDIDMCVQMALEHYGFDTSAENLIEVQELAETRLKLVSTAK